MEQEPNHRELRVRGVSEKTQEVIKNIAAHNGISVSALLRPELGKIIKSFPDYMQQPKEQ